MKQAYIVLLFILSLVLCLSCTRKNKATKKEEVFQEEVIKNELYVFLEKEVVEYFSTYNEKIKNFYFSFKKTNTNDTLFEFSYVGEIYPKLHWHGYQGFLVIDSLNVAIYDEEGLATKWYKDSLHAESFPNNEKYIPYDKKGEKRIETVSTGWIKNDVFEVLPAIKLAREDWYQYFE